MAYSIGLESDTKNLLSNMKKMGRTDPMSFADSIVPPSQEELFAMSSKYLGYDVRNIWNPDVDFQTNIVNMESLDLDNIDIPDLDAADIEPEELIGDYGKLMGLDFSSKPDYYTDKIITGLPSIDAIDIQQGTQLDELVERDFDRFIKNIMYGPSWGDLSLEQPNKILDLIQSTGRITKEGAILSSSYFNDTLKTKDVFGVENIYDAPFDEIREFINSEADIGTPEYIFRNTYNKYFQDKNLSESLELLHDDIQNKITAKPKAFQGSYTSPEQYASSYGDISSAIKPFENAASTVTPMTFNTGSSFNLENLQSLGDKPIMQAITEDQFMLRPDTMLLDTMGKMTNAELDVSDPNPDTFNSYLQTMNLVNINALEGATDIPNGFQMLSEGLSSSFFSSNVNILQHDPGSGIVSVLTKELKKSPFGNLTLTF